jgi:flavin-binding protein dodecin
MAVTKIIELVGSSPESSTGLRGDNLDEWRALVRLSILIERVNE